MLAVELVAAVMMEGDESSSMLVVDAIAAAALQCEYDALMGCCDEASGREGKGRLLASTLEHREGERDRAPGPANGAGGVTGRVGAGYTRGEYGQRVHKRSNKLRMRGSVIIH